VFGRFKKMMAISHARMLLSGIHCFFEAGFPPKTCGNDGHRYRDTMVLNALIL